MSKSRRSDVKQDQPRSTNPAFLLLRTAGDTTWRMFVPIVGGTVLGLLIDKWLGTKPWIMIALMVLGTWLALVLVLRQLAAAKKS